MRLALAFTLWILSGSHWSCEQRLTGPAEPTFDVRLVLRLSASSGDPAHPLLATATVTNLGFSTIYYLRPCVGSVMGFTVLGPDGRPVALFDPTAPLPACPDFCCQPFERGATLEEPLLFSGTLFTATGDPFPAPAGDYTVVVSFHGHSSPRGDDSIDRTRSAVFHWAGPIRGVPAERVAGTERITRRLAPPGH